jgi:hypothetical protein
MLKVIFTFLFTEPLGMDLMAVTLPTVTPLRVTLLETIIDPVLGKYAVYSVSPPRKLFPFRKFIPVYNTAMDAKAISAALISFVNFKLLFFC